ncbi:hypothetical protein RVV18_000798 [Burkholderia ambifaria]|nr:hypothetical protein [Burkholderia ambifaria]
MRLQSNYANTFKYVRKSARGLTYDVGYCLYRRDDGTFIYGFEIVQEACDGRLGSGATVLNFRGTPEQAEKYLRNTLEEMIEKLPEGWESDRNRNRKETDEGAVIDSWLIRRIYGYWPRFHDAELLSVSLRRRVSDGKGQADMELVLYHWGQDNPEWQGENRHCKLTFLLEDVDGDEFATGNVSDPSWIYDLRFSRCDDGRIQVDLEPSTGFSLLLYCAVARVICVEPYLPERT